MMVVMATGAIALVYLTSAILRGGSIPEDDFLLIGIPLFAGRALPHPFGRGSAAFAANKNFFYFIAQDGVFLVPEPGK